MSKSSQQLFQEFDAQLSKYNQVFETIAKTVQEFYTQVQTLVNKAIDLGAQFRKAITVGIDNFESPEKYNPSVVKVHPWTEELVKRESVDLLDNLKNSSLDYMLDRYEKGLEAHFIGKYQLSVFTFLSMIDGMLKEFCRKHKEEDCKYPNRYKYPKFDESLKHFTKHYELHVFVEKEKFQERLTAFFEHRNQIMHGDRHAYFDKNISTIALLFLTLIFPIVNQT